MPFLTQRDWDIAQLESEMRVREWFKEWVEALMEGRNPLDKLSKMTPQEALDLQNAPPTQLLPEQEEPMGPPMAPPEIEGM